jgi:hypothetical protein
MPKDKHENDLLATTKSKRRTSLSAADIQSVITDHARSVPASRLVASVNCHHHLGSSRCPPFFLVCMNHGCLTTRNPTIAEWAVGSSISLVLLVKQSWGELYDEPPQSTFEAGQASHTLPLIS